MLGANGTRPEVATQLIREYIYLYGAVSPRDGTCVYLIMPTSDAGEFPGLLLDVLARRFSRQDILLVLDGAPNHRSGDLVVPDNITLLYLPPYSPELDPKEDLWDEIRERSSSFARSIHGRHTRPAQAGHPLHRAQPEACPLHDLLPLYVKLTVM